MPTNFPHSSWICSTKPIQQIFHNFNAPNIQAKIHFNNTTYYIHCQTPNFKFQIPNSKFQVSNPKFQTLNSKFQIFNPKFQNLNSKFQIFNPKSQISNSKFQVLNFKDKIFFKGLQKSIKVFLLKTGKKYK